MLKNGTRRYSDGFRGRLLLLLRVVHGNVLMFRRARVGTCILWFYEAPRNCAPVHRFGNNGFCHWVFLFPRVGLSPTWPNGEWLPFGLGADTPWPEGDYLRRPNGRRIPFKKFTVDGNALSGLWWDWLGSHQPFL